MGFADAYLLKAGLRRALIKPDPHPDLHIAVTIPVYHESGLGRCLDSLFRCGLTGHSADGLSLPPVRAEVLILVNAPAEATRTILEQNRRTLKETLAWIRDHPHPGIDFHVALDHSFGKKEAGVGLARKLLMDEAVRRFNQVGTPHGIIASMDADAVVEPNYLLALTAHFKGETSTAGKHIISDHRPEGCSIYFEHPLSPRDFPFDDPAEVFDPGVYHAIVQYELHLRYYLQAVRFTGYPYAYHTVGSSFAVRADVYCMEGGMNRRKGGEDFYFIQKVAQRGRFSECNNTCVHPSPRPSDRVPFGTGTAVGRLIRSGEPLTTYDPRLFGMLKMLFSNLEVLYSGPAISSLLESMPGELTGFLHSQEFEEALIEIRGNSSSYPAFQKRFWRWFNMFRILRFLHHARERGVQEVTVEEAAIDLLKQIGPAYVMNQHVLPGLKDLLQIYRDMERLSTTFFLR